jgi:hypothetical protein
MRGQKLWVRNFETPVVVLIAFGTQISLRCTSDIHKRRVKFMHGSDRETEIRLLRNKIRNTSLPKSCVIIGQDVLRFRNLRRNEHDKKFWLHFVGNERAYITDTYRFGQ